MDYVVEFMTWLYSGYMTFGAMYRLYNDIQDLKLRLLNHFATMLCISTVTVAIPQ